MIEDLLALAAKLAQEDGEVGCRRAVSTAYYAAFHALCRLVARELVGDTATDAVFYEGVYRTLDHKISDSQPRFAITERGEEIRTALRQLREQRVNADYLPEMYSVSSANVVATLQLARTVVDLISNLPPQDARKLALSLAIDVKVRSRERFRTALER